MANDHVRDMGTISVSLQTLSLKEGVDYFLQLESFQKIISAINEMRKDAHDLTFEAERFSFRTISTFAIAGGIELLCWHEVEKHNADQKGALAARAKELVNTGRGFPSQLERYNSGRFSAPGPGSHFTWIYKMDEKIQRVPVAGLAHGDAQRKTSTVREAHIKREYDRIYKQTLEPFEIQVLPEWEKIRDRVLS